MLIGLLLNIVQASMNLANEIFKADSKIKTGDIFEAEAIYKELFQHFRDNEVFQEKYAELMMAKGSYAEIISNFEKVPRKEMELKVKKAREYLSIVVSNDTRLVASLINVSPYSRPVLKAYIQICLIDEKFEEAEKFIKKAKLAFPDAEEFVRQEVQLYFLSGRYSNGIKILNELGYGRLAQDFQDVFYSHDNVRNSRESSRSKHRSLERLLRRISLADTDNDFSPSIFTTLRLNVLFDFCRSGVESGARGLSDRALSLHMKKKSDDTMYFYTMALILDGRIEEAEEKCGGHSFKNLTLKGYIFRRIETEKAQRRAERERQERENRKRKQRRYTREQHRGPRNKGDFLGYYEALGINKNAKANEVKRAYSNIIVKNKGKKKTKKEEEKWNELFKKINKARVVLVDPKKRELYDSGIDPDNPQPQFGGGFEYGGDPFQDIFRDFGAFNFSGERGRRGGGTTYFYFG